MKNYDIPTIVVLDSGIGGVAVLNKLIENQIYCNYIYIADNDFMPYGNKNRTKIQNRARELIDYIFKKYNPDFIIVACNTMSSCAKIDDNRVIVMKFIKSKQYLATRLTKKNLKDFNVISDCRLASLIEKNHLNEIKMSRTIQHIVQHKNLGCCKNLVLGCTHYELCERQFANLIEGNVECNSKFILPDIKRRLKRYNIHSELNVVVETTRRSFVVDQKIFNLISNRNDW